MPTPYFDKLKRGNETIEIQDTTSGYQTASDVADIITTIIGEL